MSSTLAKVDDLSVTLVRSDPLGLVRALKQRDGLDIYLAGGGKLAGARVEREKSSLSLPVARWNRLQS